MPDIKQPDAVPDVIVARDGTHTSIRERHRVARKRHHLRPILDVEGVQARFPQLLIVSVFRVYLKSTAMTRLTLTSPASVAKHLTRSPANADLRTAVLATLASLEHAMADMADEEQVCGTCCALEGALYATPRRAPSASREKGSSRLVSRLHLDLCRE